ncbi:phosphonatase-like hydrolase [Mycetocola lacteus]|uniref:Phosphonatase-like hydrolase n=1 Tax=Mycetocola lacteus TaxID=76637 RepID=A0A3L7AMR6_9MICO|nr:phosphonatase-like hydrolase [Mycetocola lacteus]RLP80768.1 phosphonatase-like hydrolase [Mycetocola lacteus]RLP84553.1 phosphonatase-like hydrolase [Mycetocola lacteus]
MIQLAVFDMAGTTIDDGGAVYRALAEAVRETGATVAPSDLQAWMGTEKHAALSALIILGGGTATPELIDAAYSRFATILAENYAARPPKPLPGIPETLTALRAAGIQVALTTGFTRAVATGILDGLGWRIGAPTADNTVSIDALVCGDEVAAGRPAPYLIHRAMERTGVVDVARVLTAGDTVVDVQSGINAGVARTVGVLTGELTAQDFADAGFSRDSHQRVSILASVTEIPAHMNDK